MILHWNYRNLKEIPEELLQSGNHIKEIYLKRNNLTSLPKDIGKLGSLTNLYLVSNQIAVLPLEIEQLCTLRVLDLSQNFLEFLPPNIGKLERLEQLVITQNHLLSLPKELGLLKSLKFLELTGNSLSSLPSDVVQGLEALEQLSVDGNPITHLPRIITKLKNLRYISVCRCKLLYLPSSPFHYLVNGRRRDAVSRFQNENSILNSFQLLFDNNPELNFVPLWVLQYLGSDIGGFGCGFSLHSKSERPLGKSPSLDHRPTMTHCGARVTLIQQGLNHILCFDEDLMKIHSEETSNEPLSLLEQSIRVAYIENLFKSPNPNLKDPGKEPQLKYSSQQNPNDTLSSSSPASQTLYDYSDPSSPSFEQDNIQGSNIPHITTGHDYSDDEALNESSSSSSSLPPPLPLNLSLILEQGFLSLCFVCMKPIFTEAWVQVFGVPKMNDDNHNRFPRDNPPPQNLQEIIPEQNNVQDLQISCVYFCSKACHANRDRNLITDDTEQDPLFRYVVENSIPFTIT